MHPSVRYALAVRADQVESRQTSQAGRRRFDPGRPLHFLLMNSRLFGRHPSWAAGAIFKFTQYAPKADKLNARNLPPISGKRIKKTPFFSVSSRTLEQGGQGRALPRAAHRKAVFVERRPGYLALPKFELFARGRVNAVALDRNDMSGSSGERRVELRTQNKSLVE